MTWMQRLAAGVCIFTMLLRLLPGGTFSRYVTFYAGMLFCLLAAEPVFNLLAGEGELERFLKLEFLKETCTVAENTLEGLDELKNDSIFEAYRSELTQRIRETIAACGAKAEDIQLTFQDYLLQHISADVQGLEKGSAQETLLLQNLSELFSLEQSQISLTYREDAGS